LFFGGWHFPFIAEAASAYPGAWVVKVAVLLFKVSCMIVLIQMLRWTIPRFRFDQLMSLAWKGLIPMATANVLIVMCVLEFNLPRIWLFPLSVALFVAVGLIGTQASLPAGGATVRRKKVTAPVVAAAHH
ncbi:MAG: NADH-quinone oxidoreductase subunit H, partial [Planctomycetaceae bacterium]|nr:NADH-quinone oxidoreductase subunit H [Planctomycetaceae bacterium]